MMHGIIFIGRIIGRVVVRVMVVIREGRVGWLFGWIALWALLIGWIVVIWGFSAVVVAHIINLEAKRHINTISSQSFVHNANQ